MKEGSKILINNLIVSLILAGIIFLSKSSYAGFLAMGLLLLGFTGLYIQIVISIIMGISMLFSKDKNALYYILSGIIGLLISFFTICRLLEVIWKF